VIRMVPAATTKARKLEGLSKKNKLLFFASSSCFCVFVVTASRADACTCVGGRTTCQAFYEETAVFVGRVDAITLVTPAHPFSKRRVRLAVTEAFRGVSAAQIEIVTGAGHGDCGYPFKIGESYFVYAYRERNSATLATGVCSRTRLLRDAAEDLAFARAQKTAPPFSGAPVCPPVDIVRQPVSARPR